MMSRLKYFNNGNAIPRGGQITQQHARMSHGIGYHPIYGYGVYGGTHTSNYDDLQENISDYFSGDFVGYDQAIKDNEDALWLASPDERATYLAEIDLLERMKLPGGVPKYSNREIEADFIDDPNEIIIKKIQLDPELSKEYLINAKTYKDTGYTEDEHKMMKANVFAKNLMKQSVVNELERMRVEDMTHIEEVEKSKLKKFEHEFQNKSLELYEFLHPSPGVSYTSQQRSASKKAFLKYKDAYIKYVEHVLHAHPGDPEHIQNMLKIIDTITSLSDEILPPVDDEAYSGGPTLVYTPEGHVTFQPISKELYDEITTTSLEVGTPDNIHVDNFDYENPVRMIAPNFIEQLESVSHLVQDNRIMDEVVYTARHGESSEAGKPLETNCILNTDNDELTQSIVRAAKGLSKDTHITIVRSDTDTWVSPGKYAGFDGRVGYRIGDDQTVYHLLCEMKTYAKYKDTGYDSAKTLIYGSKLDEDGTKLSKGPQHDIREQLGGNINYGENERMKMFISQVRDRINDLNDQIILDEEVGNLTQNDRDELKKLTKLFNPDNQKKLYKAYLDRKIYEGVPLSSTKLLKPETADAEDKNTQYLIKRLKGSTLFPEFNKDGVLTGLKRTAKGADILGVVPKNAAQFGNKFNDDFIVITGLKDALMVWNLSQMMRDGVITDLNKAYESLLTTKSAYKGSKNPLIKTNKDVFDSYLLPSTEGKIVRIPYKIRKMAVEQINNPPPKAPSKIKAILNKTTKKIIKK